MTFKIEEIIENEIKIVQEEFQRGLVNSETEHKKHKSNPHRGYRYVNMGYKPNTDKRTSKGFQHMGFNTKPLEMPTPPDIRMFKTGRSTPSRVLPQWGFEPSRVPKMNQTEQRKSTQNPYVDRYQQDSLSDIHTDIFNDVFQNNRRIRR